MGKIVRWVGTGGGSGVLGTTGTVRLKVNGPASTASGVAVTNGPGVGRVPNGGSDGGGGGSRVGAGGAGVAEAAGGAGGAGVQVVSGVLAAAGGGPHAGSGVGGGGTTP